MTEIRWELGDTDPNAQARAYSYADKIRQNAAGYQAGAKYAAGDIKGAAQTQALAGDIPAAQATEKVGTDRAEAAYEYIGKALPVFEAVAQQHASDPDGGAGAIGAAFDQLAPEIAQVTGHNNPQELAQIRQQLASNPQATIQRIKSALPVKYQTVGKTLVRTQGSAPPEAVFTAPETHEAPSGFTWADPNKTALAPIPGGPGDPKYKGTIAEQNRAIIINNPLPQRGGGEFSGGGDSLSPDALNLQVDTHIASRGAIIPQFGMGKSGAEHRDKFYNTLAKRMAEQGITANDIASGRAEYKANAAALGQVSKMRNSVQSYEQTVQKNIGIVENLLGKGARNGAPVINRWIQAGRASLSGDPDVTAYNTAIQTVVNEYAKVMAGGTGSSAASSDSARAEAAHLLNNAQTPEQVRAAVRTMRQEMANRIESLKAQENDLKSRLGNRPGGGEGQQGQRPIKIDINGKVIP